MRKIRKLLGVCYKMLRVKVRILKNYFMAALCHWMPLEDKIVFISYGGKGYGCNPKYIANALIQQNTPYDMVWLLKNMEDHVPEPIRKVPFHGFQGIREIATAKVIVANTKGDLRLIKKKGQYVIQTWHASYNPKMIEKNAIGKLPEQYIRESIRNSAQTDLFLSNSRVLSEEYRSGFWCECEIMECGFPRNDILFNWDRKIPARVREEFGIPKDSRIVLYAPTFRDDFTVDAFNIDTEAVIKTLNGIGGDWYLIIRMHPNVAFFQNHFRYDDHILNGTPYPDMQDLLLASDILITDYSSTFYEFAILEKPSYIYAPDVEAYQKMRGLKPDFFRMPYPVCQTNEELLALLKMYTPESGRENAREFMDHFGGTDQGDASLKVAARIVKIMEGK